MKTTKEETTEVLVFDARTCLDDLHKKDDNGKFNALEKIANDKNYMECSWGWINELQGIKQVDCEKLTGYRCNKSWTVKVKKYKKMTQKQFNAICNNRIKKIQKEMGE